MENVLNFFLRALQDNAALITGGYIVIPLIVARLTKGVLSRILREKFFYYSVFSFVLMAFGITASFFLAALTAGGVACDSAMLEDCKEDLLQRDAAGRLQFWATVYEFYKWNFVFAHLYFTIPAIMLCCVILLIKLVKK